MEKKIGEFVLQGNHILTIYSNKALSDIHSIINDISIGQSRSMFQDIEFGIQKLVEVALRAISPGINDPNTTIHCVKILGVILSHISLSHLNTTYYHDDDDTLRLTMKYSDFDDLLYLAYSQIRYYSDEDVSVLNAMLESLCIIVESNTLLQEKIWSFGIYLIKGFSISGLEYSDKKYINNKIKKLARLTERDPKSLLFN